MSITDYMYRDEQSPKNRAARADAELRRHGYSRNAYGEYANGKPLSPRYRINEDGDVDYADGGW